MELSGKTKAEPNLKDLLDLFRTDLLLSFNCHAIAKIESFNSAKQTCEASIAYKKTYSQRQADGTYQSVLIDYPPLIDIPVLIIGGVGSYLTFPADAIIGSEALILFNDRDMDNWFIGASGKGVASQRLHSFSDGIAITGLRSMLSKIMDYDSDRVVLRRDDLKLQLGTKLKVNNTAASLFDALDQTLSALETLLTSMQSATPVNVAATVGTPSGVALTAITAARLLLSEVME